MEAADSGTAAVECTGHDGYAEDDAWVEGAGYVEADESVKAGCVRYAASKYAACPACCTREEPGPVLTGMAASSGKVKDTDSCCPWK